MIGFTGIRIAANGDVYSCYQYDTVGNILHNKLDEILSSRRTYDTVTNMYHLKCSTCQVN
ncbi:MAG: hypothetical protein B6D35_06945 [Candidatus Brocadia sp. UTAMX2]|nr:MAG: hypothetical protein B6D35_06945 [Candidatus Brocadia sp. UTAMX2]